MNLVKQLLCVTLCISASLGATVLAADTPDWDEMIAPEALQEDLTALYEGLRESHPDLFAHRSKTEYDAKFKSMLNSLDEPLSRFDAQLMLQRFAAYGNVAHARIEFPNEAFAEFRDNGGKTLPIYPRIVDGTAYVGTNFSDELGIQAGDEIVAINGRPMDEWLTTVAELSSADTPYIAHSLLEFTFPRDLWAVIGEQATFELTVRRDGDLRTISIDATTQAAQDKVAEGREEDSGLDAYARSFRMIDDNIAYLRPGPFYNVENPTELWDNSAFIAFIDRAFTHFIDQDADALVIDLRQNPGGDNSFSDPMLSWIADREFRFYDEFLIRSSDAAAAANAERLDTRPGAAESVSAMFAREYARVPRGESFAFELPFAQPRADDRFEGDVYALINRHSFSNAVSVAAIIQDYEFGIVAGEKTSDMATTFGAMEQFTLPRTGIAVGFPKAHIIRPSGDRKTDGVTPDWPINSPIVEGANDIVLDQLVERIRTTG
ncbi:MAG: S41 family peptidase [Pseudomonadota bacterium]